MNKDILLETLSMNLPFGGGRAHHNLLRRELTSDIKTVLDVGCGRGTFRVFRNFNTTGIDIFRKSIEIARRNGNYKYLMIGDVSEMCFPDNYFDAVTCIEVVEHLEKPDAIKLIGNLERIARKKVIITTPWGFDDLPKGKENRYLEHQCGFEPMEFKQRGYRTGAFALIRWRFGNATPTLIVGYVLSVICNLLIRMFPDKLSNNFWAVLYKGVK